MKKNSVKCLNKRFQLENAFIYQFCSWGLPENSDYTVAPAGNFSGGSMSTIGGLLRVRRVEGHGRGSTSKLEKFSNFSNKRKNQNIWRNLILIIFNEILLFVPKYLKIYSNSSQKFGQKFRKIKKYAFQGWSRVPPEASEFIKIFD